MAPKTTETTAAPAETATAAETTASRRDDTAAGAETKDPNAKVENKDKPLVWFNRQPSSSATGQLDMTALNYNKDTYYVGFDANQGAEASGYHGKDYIEKILIPLTATVTALSVTFWLSATSDIMTRSHVQEAFVRHLERQ